MMTRVSLQPFSKLLYQEAYFADIIASFCQWLVKNILSTHGLSQEDILNFDKHVFKLMVLVRSFKVICFKTRASSSL